MKIEIRLKKVLNDHGLDRHGVVQKIATGAKVHRRTIGKLYNNTARNPSLRVLGLVCDWLIRNGVPAASLPHALIGCQPSGLWEAVAQPGLVTLYLGQYEESADGAAVMLWLSRRDSTVAAEIVKELTTPTSRVRRRNPPRMSIQYVPFEFHRLASRINRKHVEGDIKRSESFFRRMVDLRGRSSSIIIGSQRVNYLLEHFVADLFSCKPFEPVSKEIRVPFHLVYRDRDRAVPSCFGGFDKPLGMTGPRNPGLHYLHTDEDGKLQWVRCPWKSRHDDAGVVIICRYDRAVEMALFGFSGWATESLGRQLLSPGGTSPFWPLTYRAHKGAEIGIYVCVLNCMEETLVDQGSAVVCRNIKIIPLGESLLDQLIAYGPILHPSEFTAKKKP